jgi:putative sigma-54 modulation protein
MVVEEAAMQLENTDDEFLVFLNAENERINVIYRRKSGNFGLIDPGV